MKMALEGTIAVALIFICSVRAVMAQSPASAPAPGPDASNSTTLYEYYNLQSDGLYKSLDTDRVRACIIWNYLSILGQANSWRLVLNSYDHGQNN